MRSVATTSNNTDKQQPKTAKEVIAANVQSRIQQLERAANGRNGL